jgi:hypothetical protein
MSWRDDLNYGLAAFGVQLPASIPLDDWAAKLATAPLRNATGLVAATSAAFLAAERGHNPKVRDIYDALIYCSTCLSVGYSDIFARTPIGKLIGTFLMTIGPSLAAKSLDGRGDAAESAANRDATQEEILATLKGILSKMETQPLPAPSNGSP